MDLGIYCLRCAQNLKEARQELADQRQRVVSDKSDKDRPSSKAEFATKEQLAERNSLLSDIFQAVDKGLGSSQSSPVCLLFSVA